MCSKTCQLAEYFGEDVAQQPNLFDPGRGGDVYSYHESSKIFTALEDFRMALAFSREATGRRRDSENRQKQREQAK